MAQIKIRVPRDWPDFTVTSYYRPGDKGSHGKRGGALDITPIWPTKPDKSSPFWFYYYQTFVMLVAAQRYGVLRMAVPPECPHFHISTNKNIARFGAELTQKRKDINGKSHCVTVLHWDVDNRKHLERIDGLNKIRHVIGNNYWASIYGTWQDLKYKFSKNEKYITVHALPGVNGINEHELQTLLDDLFGDGSNWQYFKDQASQIIGYLNKDEAPDFGGGLVLAALAVGAFFLMREK